MLKNKMRQIIFFLCFCMIFSMPAFAGLDFEATAKTDLTMSFIQRPDVDVVLTVGNSDLDMTNFETDLRARIEAKGIDLDTVDISSITIQTTSTADADAGEIFGSWTNYPAPPNPDNPSSYDYNLRYYGPGEWEYLEEEQTIRTTQNVGWTGYWDESVNVSDVDFSCKIAQFASDDDNIGITFRMNLQGEAKDLRNYSFYTYITDMGGPNRGAIDSGLYKKTIGIFPEQYQMELLQADDFLRQRDIWYDLQVKMDGNHIEIYRDGEKVIDYTDNDPLPSGAYGVFTYSQAYGYFKDITIQSSSKQRFSEVIRKPSWRSSSERFIVNLDDELIGDFEDEMALSEILYRTLNEDIHYIGWGNNSNEEQAHAFVADNNGMGTFVNRDTTEYTAAIDQIATYIAGKVNAKTITSKSFDSSNPNVVGTFIAGTPISIKVDPSDLKTNTVTTEYPNGRWRVDQDPNYYKTPGGTMWWDNTDQDDLPEEYTQPGEYDFYFENTLVSKANFHRKPVAKFVFNPEDNTITDLSYDLDGEIVARAWKWKEVTATSSTEVSDRSWILREPTPADFLAGHEYIVQLRVLDAQNTWSNTTSKYISTTTTITSVPIADFDMTPDYLQKHLGTTVVYTNKAYDPQGRSIIDTLWTVYGPDGGKVHESATPLTDFTEAVQGDYTIQMKVMNDQEVWSEVYTKTLTVVDDLINPTIVASQAENSVLLSPFEVTLTFSDDGGSGFKRQSVTLTNTTSGESTPLGWSSAKVKTVTLDEDGIWDITAIAEDQKGNTTTKTFKGYLVDATAPTKPVISGASAGWTSGNVSVSVAGSTDANAITYQIAVSDGMPSDSDWTNATSKSFSSTGEYHVWARALDSVGNVSEMDDTWVRIDKTAPVFTSFPADRNMEVKGSYVQDTVVASDSDSGLDGEVGIDSSAVNTAILGKYEVIYTVTNKAGLTTSRKQIISVVDTTAPVLALVGQPSVDVEVHGSYTDAGATATDNYESAEVITGKIVPSDDIDLHTVDSYTVTYNVSDASGNAATAIRRTVNVVDTTAPVLHLTGSPAVDVEVHTGYTDAGATATDNYDAASAITALVKSNNNIDLHKVGSYKVTYTVTDANGNVAEAIERVVNVVDTTAPVITVSGSNPVDTEVHLKYVDAGATATDNYDADDAITAAIKASDDLDLHTVGVYTVTYNATDANGNAAAAKTRTVKVVDTTSPVLALVGQPSVDVEVHTSYTDAGATATDNYDAAQDITAAIVANDDIDLHTVGTYTVTYNVTDANKNAASTITRTVNVVDTTKPELTLLGDAEIFMDQGDSYTDAGATATDNYDSDESITGAIRLTNPLNVNTIGVYTLHYDVTDANGNAADPIERVIHVIHPLAVSTAQAEQVGSYQANFVGAIDHYGVKPVMEHGFVYDRDASKTNVLEAEGVLQLGAESQATGFKAKATKLSPGTSYYVRAYAVKAEGVVYGEAVQVKTQAAPAKPVSTQNFGDTSVHTVNPDRLSGQIKTDDQGVTALSVESQTDATIQQVQVPLSAVDQINAMAARDGGKPELQIGTPIGSMNLPTEDLGSSSLIPEDFTGDLTSARLHVTIEQVDEDTAKIMEEATGVTGLVAPIRFDLTLKTDQKIDERTTRVETTPIDAFENLVVRSITAPKTEGPLMAVVFDEDAQEWVPVLSRTVVDENGNVSVEILHREMGVYTLVEREPVEVLGLEGSDAKEAIETLASMGVLPYEKGSKYQPNMGITRAEMAYTMVRLMGITQAQGQAVDYPDVAGHRYTREIQLATQAGIFTGYGDGLFRGDQVITREELAAVVERAVKYVEMTEGLDPEAANLYRDEASIDFWSVDSVGRLTDAGVIKAEENDRYRPQEQASKAEAATMLANFLQMINQ